ncbi:Ig-like domain-containing protein, partial [Crenothrix polyspora]|uniref:Ig-like domain-containing protein n=1 Tax=Crenothrix polyspora TaxID=360316 RepID=UPI001FE64BF4
MSILLKVNNSTGTLNNYVVTKGKVAHINAQPGANYAIVNENGAAPKRIVTKRVGNDLQIILDDGTSPDIIIDGYYAQSNSELGAVVGQAADGKYYSYAIASDGGVATLGTEAIGSLSEAVSAGGSGLSNGMLGAIGVLGLGAIGGGIALASGGGGDSNDKSPAIATGKDFSSKYIPETGVVSGNGALPGSEVTASLPDGTKFSVIVNPDGSYSFPAFNPPLSNGEAISVHAANKTIIVKASDTTAMTGDYDSKTGVISGNGATPGSKVVVTLPDGSKISDVVKADGSYSLSLLNPKPSKSEIITVTVDNEKVVIKTITPPDGSGTGENEPLTASYDVKTGVISGSGAAAGKKVTATLPDGASVSALVRDNGSYKLPAFKPAPSNGETITITADNEKAVIKVLDTTAPIAPLETDVMVNSDGTLSARGGKGSAEPGSTIKVTFPDNTSGSAIVAANGSYGPITSSAAQISGSVTILAKDAAGNSSAPVSIKVDATIPALPTINATDGSPITGVAEAGSVVTVKDAAGALIGTATADPVTGAYSVVPTTVPVNGTVLNVTATDAAGNSSALVSIKVDATIPALPTINATDGSPITGVAEAGSVVIIKDAAGVLIGTATADPVTGAYSIVPTTVPANGTVLNVIVTDAAGNTSAPVSIKVDVTAPALPTINATDGSPITGVAEAGSVVTIKDAAGTVIGTATADPVTGAYSIVPAAIPANGTILTVTATDAAGNTSALVSIKVDATIPALPTINATDGSPITGVAEAGSVITVKDAAGVLIGTATADPVTGAYSIVPAAIPANGTVLNVTATDAAGNTSALVSIKVDATIPALPTINATDGSPITGVAEAGSVVTIKDAAGVLIGTATADPVTGAYSIVPAAIPANGTVLNVTATDAAGNTSIPVSIKVDATIPALPTINATDGSPITGVAEAGSVVIIKDAAGVLIGTATADPVTGAYSVVPTTVPVNGTVLNVTATDAAGNTSALVSIKVDATIPALPTINATDGSPITGVA